MTGRWIPAAAFSLMLMLASPGFADESVSTLTLDSLSFISFGDHEVLPIPSGSTVRFRFGPPEPDGTVPFTIEPGDLSIPPISSRSGTLDYSMAEPASGTMRPTKNGRTIEFDAIVRARLVRPDGTGGTMEYSMPFSTESTSAANLAKTRTVRITGMRLVEGAWYAQIVGATVNKRNAYPKPGTAVYTVLSGTFDRIPQAERGDTHSSRLATPPPGVPE